MPTLADPAVGLGPADLLWVVAGWFAFFFTNNALVSMLAGDEGRTFAQDFFDDFSYYFITTFAVLALSPLVVFVADQPIYLPLLLLAALRGLQDGVDLAREGTPVTPRCPHRLAEPQDDSQQTRREH